MKDKTLTIRVSHKTLAILLLLFVAVLVQSATLTPLGDASITKVPYIGATQNIDAGVFNFTAALFRGAFNWTEITPYLSFDSVVLDFNETKLNATILNLTASITYSPVSIDLVSGTLDAGNLTSILELKDNDSYNVSEDSGANPLTIYVNFSDVTTLDAVAYRVWYEGGQGHEINVGLWDYTTNSYEYEYTDITDQDTFITTVFTVLDPADHVSDGFVNLSFWHEQTGIPAHNFYLDYVSLVEGFTTLTNAEHDSLSGRDSTSNHPWALATDGSKNMTGNLNVNANITSTDEYCNATDCYELSEFLTDADTNTWWGLNERYIYNNSNSLDFNETLLNTTISALDTDTNCTISGSCNTIVYADGNTPLTDNWAAGDFNITGLDELDANKVNASESITSPLFQNTATIKYCPSGDNDDCWITATPSNQPQLISNADVAYNTTLENTALGGWYFTAGHPVGQSNPSTSTRLKPAFIRVYGYGTPTVGNHRFIQLSNNGSHNVISGGTGISQDMVLTSSKDILIAANNSGHIYLGENLAAFQKHLTVDAGGFTGIGIENPTNLLTVFGAGADVGGFSGADEVMARFQRNASGHTGVSVDSLAGFDSILYMSEAGEAMWDIRSDASLSDDLEVRWQGRTQENDIRFIIDNAGSVYIGADKTAANAGDLYADGVFTDNGSVGEWDVEGFEYYDIGLLKGITAKKGSWDLSGIVKLDSKGKVTQSVLNTIEVEKTELRNITLNGETFEERIGTGEMVNSTWINTAELNGFLIGVLKAQQAEIEELERRLCYKETTCVMELGIEFVVNKIRDDIL